jgi:hypothetical protein
VAILFKLSFIITGLFFRHIIFENIQQISEILFLLFVAVTLYQYLYVFIFYKRDGSEMSHGACLARWALCYSITIEVIIVFTLIMDFGFRGGYGDIFATRSSLETPYKILIFLSTCIAYQIIYVFIKSRKK